MGMAGHNGSGALRRRGTIENLRLGDHIRSHSTNACGSNPVWNEKARGEALGSDTRGVLCLRSPSSARKAYADQQSLDDSPPGEDSEGGLIDRGLTITTRPSQRTRGTTRKGDFGSRGFTGYATRGRNREVSETGLTKRGSTCRCINKQDWAAEKFGKTQILGKRKITG